MGGAITHLAITRHPGQLAGGGTVPQHASVVGAARETRHDTIPHQGRRRTSPLGWLATGVLENVVGPDEAPRGRIEAVQPALRAERVDLAGMERRRGAWTDPARDVGIAICIVVPP